jgi:hypothetical protein
MHVCIFLCLHFLVAFIAKCIHDGHAIGCCVHGMATFPHWHRLYVVDVETALLNQGSAASVPYWDWTSKSDGRLPSLVNEYTFFNSRAQRFQNNPFFRGNVINEANTQTSRLVQHKYVNACTYARTRVHAHTPHMDAHIRLYIMYAWCECQHMSDVSRKLYGKLSMRKYRLLM